MESVLRIKDVDLVILPSCEHGTCSCDFVGVGGVFWLHVRDDGHLNCGFTKAKVRCNHLCGAFVEGLSCIQTLVLT